MSEIAQSIDAIIRGALVKPLKADGYRKSGRNFHLAAEGVIKVVNVQASQGNLGNTGKFTINLGVYIAEIAKLLDRALKGPGMPRESESTIRIRIGKNDWWEIDSKTDLERLAENVQEVWLTQGKTWMDQDWHDLAKARDMLVAEHMYEPAIAAAILLKDKESANRLAREGYEWVREANPRSPDYSLKGRRIGAKS